MTIRTKIATFGIIAALAGGMVGTSAPIASAAPVAAPTATSYFRAGATVNFPTTWTAGQPLTVTGQGFRTRSGRSVTVVLRGDEGEIYHEVRPDANGKFTTSIPWSNSLQAGQSIEFETFALTRGGFYEGSEVDVRVVAAPARQNPAPQPKTTTGAAQKPAEKDKSGENKNGGGSDGGSTSGDKNNKDGNGGSGDNKNQGSSGGDNNSGGNNNNAGGAQSGGGSDPSASPQGGQQDSNGASGGAIDSSEPDGPSDKVSASASESSPSASASASASGNKRFHNCKEVKDAGLAPIHKDHPDFQEGFDADHDGVGCDKPADFGNEPVTITTGAAAGDSSASTEASGEQGSSGQGFSPADLADPGKNGVLLAAGYVLIVGGIGGAIFLAVRKMRKE